MGRFTISGFEDADRLFEAIGKPQDFAFKAVKEAAPILEKHARKAVKNAIQAHKNKTGAHNSTGGLEKSIQATKVKKNKYGVYSVIQPVGKDKKKKPSLYVQRAACLEFGTHARKARGSIEKGDQIQTPSPWRQAAINAAEEECSRKMQAVVYEEIERATQ